MSDVTGSRAARFGQGIPQSVKDELNDAYAWELVCEAYDEVEAGGAGSWDFEVQLGERVKHIVRKMRRA